MRGSCRKVDALGRVLKSKGLVGVRIWYVFWTDLGRGLGGGLDKLYMN